MKTHKPVEQLNVMTQLVLKPTLYCSHQCVYCSQRQEYYKQILSSGDSRNSISANKSLSQGHMPLEMALLAIDEAAANGMTTLQISGGDPLLYPHLTAIIKEASRYKNVFVFINSVGEGISIYKARELIDSGLGAWNFSIDTLEIDTYENLRGRKGGLRRIINATETVQKAAKDYPHFCINYMTVITRYNFRHIPNLLEHCIEKGIASIYLMHVYGEANKQMFLTEAEIEEFRNITAPTMLEVIYKNTTDQVVHANATEVVSSFFSSNHNTVMNFANGIYWAERDTVRHVCRAPNYYALIEPDGRVLPCCMLEISHDNHVGNLNNQSLSEIWLGSSYQQFRKNRIEFCLKCPSALNRTLGLIPSMCRQFNG